MKNEKSCQSISTKNLTSPDKAIRDREMGLRILSAAQMTGKMNDASLIWTSFTKKEQKVILDVTKKEGREDLIASLQKHS